MNPGMSSATEQLRVLEVLKRDEWSVAGRAIDASGHGPQLVRRLIPERRFDEVARASLRAEVEYGARLGSADAPGGELVEYPDGELVLRYTHKEGIELDRVLFALNARGWVLSAKAAATLVGPVLEMASRISQHPPPDLGEVSSFGHGEIAARSLLLGRDGVARLFEARCAACALPWSRTADGRLALAPELPRPLRAGTTEGDVFAVASVLASSVVGIRRLIALEDLPLAEAFERETLLAEESQGLDRGFSALVIRALSAEPSQRVSLRSMALALKHGLGLDETITRQIRLGLADLVALLSERRDLMDVPEEYRHRFAEVLVPMASKRRVLSQPPPGSGTNDLPIPRSGSSASLRPASSIGLAADPRAGGPDVSQGFALEVLDDWSSMTRHLTGTFVVPRGLRERARRRRRQRRLIMVAAVLLSIVALGALMYFVKRQLADLASISVGQSTVPASADPSPSPSLSTTTPPEIAARVSTGTTAAVRIEAAAKRPETPPPAPGPTAESEPKARVERPRPPPGGAAPRPARRRIGLAPPPAEAPVPLPSVAPAVPPAHTYSPEPEPVEAGRLVVTVTPPARVSIDGEDVGYPPIERAGLTPGLHVIRVEREGFETVERTVRLRRAETKSLRIFLRAVDDGS